MTTDRESPEWRQISVTTARIAMAEAVFEHFGAAAISELDAGKEPTVELTPYAQPRFDISKIVGLFPRETSVDAIRHDLIDALGTDIIIEVNDVERQDWAKAWIVHHPPLYFGGRLWVAPHGAQVDTHTDQDVIVRLDPGLAFGTGTHPTTALCLTWLAHADLTGCSVLDYGCGSGILAIAADLLGAKRVCAVDIDKQAVRATRENAEANGVASHIETPAIDDAGPERYDIILANILARPLMSLAPTLTALMQPGGRLVLSGLLHRQVEAVQRAYTPHFKFAEPAQQDDWMRLDGVQNTSRQQVT